MLKRALKSKKATFKVDFVLMETERRIYQNIHLDTACLALRMAVPVSMSSITHAPREERLTYYNATQE